MPKEPKRPLKVFLCHASGDKPQVRALYKHLIAEGVDAWLDQEKLLPGQDWRVEIPRAVQESDVVVICLSNKSVTKEGYIQKEIKFALDKAQEKLDDTIFLIPARLEECSVPEQLSRWQWVDLYEDNGFVKLMRSLKLRAKTVDAVIEQSSDMEDDTEVEHRLSQLYTEGLEAFYTENWERACQRFQSILNERPNHKNATEKFEEAERQRDLSKLYAQSTEAYKLENWQVAIKTLEELSQKSVDYKDTRQLLKNAKKQKQLKDLYIEAKALHTAQKWHAVLKVFEQISGIDSTFPDSDGLLPSAQKEAAEIKRLAELNGLYSNAVREMEASQWYEARKLLEQVHKTQTGFLETERLLRKIEDEIAKVEELNNRNNQVNTLYEQAHGLARSKNWRKVLDKQDEIRKLDDQFADNDKIFEKARNELVLEEQKIKQQNELAAIYADAVRLLKDGNFQESLDRWQELKAIDSKYPDRQMIQKIATKRLMELQKSPSVVYRASRSGWLYIGGVFIIIAALFGVFNKSVTALFYGTSIPTPSPMAKVTPAVTPIAAYSWEFNKNGDMEYFGDDIHSIQSVKVADGSLSFRSFAVDPYIGSPCCLKIQASWTPIIAIRMRVSAGENWTLYFITSTDTNMEDNNKIAFFKIIADGDFHSYFIDMSERSYWRGTVTKFRLDPDDVVADIQIDYIRVQSSQ